MIGNLKLSYWSLVDLFCFDPGIFSILHLDLNICWLFSWILRVDDMQILVWWNKKLPGLKQMKPSNQKDRIHRIVLQFSFIYSKIYFRNSDSIILLTFYLCKRRHYSHYYYRFCFFNYIFSALDSSISKKAD